MKKTAVIALLFLSCASLIAKDYSVSSPDGKISVTVSVGPDIRWTAYYGNEAIFNSSKIGLELQSGNILGENEKIKKAGITKLNETITPVVPYKRSLIIDNCNELRLQFRSGFSIQFRAYNDGIAYRFGTSLKDELIIRNEIAELDFPEGSHSWFPKEDRFMSHNERIFNYTSMDSIKDQLASLPTLFVVKNINILLTESDIEDYPGMWLTGRGSGKISGTWPKYPDKEQLKGDRSLFVTSTKDYIATVKGTRTFPWRVFAINTRDIDLLSNDLVFRLARENQIQSPSWIKPGKVAWDYFYSNNIYGVDFRAGFNNDTYKYYIDFAAANGLEYIILDEGWYKLPNVTQEIPEINVRELCEYGKSRNVGVILWVVWKSLWDKMDEAMSLYEKWGVRGLKIDFMQRDDQKIVNFYEETARKAAEHHLVVDFHGSYKPDGISRAWPNVLTREGVKGLENAKVGRNVNPEHDVTIPYTRMVAGPMDYTPGSLINMDNKNFSANFTRPESMGTRAHQVAMYVIYESPLQMLSDSPSTYKKEQETTDFIKNIPVVWDDIVCLDGKIGDFVLIARKSGKDWFAGAMTDWTARDIDIDFSFLPTGNYNIEIFQDGINADRYAADYKILTKKIKSGDKMKVHLAPGGGWAARITPVS